MHKYLSALVTLTLSTSTTLSVDASINDNTKNNNQVVNIIQRVPTYEKKLNIRIIAQETNYFSGAAGAQTVLDYFGIEMSQNTIFEQLEGQIEYDTEWTEENVEWLNRRLADHDAAALYSRTPVPAGFGQTHQDLVLFQNYVISSLHQNTPILLVNFGLTDENQSIAQTVVIYGIQVEDELDPSRTLYNVSVPGSRLELGRDITIDGRTVLGVLGDFVENQYASVLIGANRNFDLKNGKITIHIPEIRVDRYFGADLQLRLHNINLAKEAGIRSVHMLQEFSRITIPDYSLSTKWFDKSCEEKDVWWDTSRFIDGSTPFNKVLNQSWTSTYRNVAEGEFTTKTSSRTWLENNQDFYLNLSYQFSARVVLTTTLIYAKICLGTKWVLTF
ncbi:MAG: hypothetical protein REH79_03765 [Spiroplasma sp.]|nr:hypothetical protein [Spiroplasma sp.]